jgi:hypothetical protein
MQDPLQFTPSANATIFRIARAGPSHSVYQDFCPFSTTATVIQVSLGEFATDIIPDASTATYTDEVDDQLTDMALAVERAGIDAIAFAKLLNDWANRGPRLYCPSGREIFDLRGIAREHTNA